MSVVKAPAVFTQVQWREALQSTATELSRVALSFTGGSVRDPAPIPEGLELVGAHIPMVGKPSYELSFLSTPDQASELASAVLGGMDLADLPPRATADALCEIVNMLAGGVKRRLPPSDLELGLPVYASGTPHASMHVAMHSFPVLFGPIAGFVVVLGAR